MPTLRELLDRFRSAGPPGPPAPAAVPADRRSRLEDEVAPVFAALASTAEQAAGMVAAARAEAEHIRDQGRREADALIGRAEQERQAGYAEAFAETRGAAARRSAASAAKALRSADEIARVAAQRRPALVELAMRRISDSIEAAPGSTVP
ncbi:MAG: hypothetical protein SYR96_22660 [Actinomycetota bacterium]|nr:hypothetical protein [Actinomycetota bacterium]